MNTANKKNNDIAEVLNKVLDGIIIVNKAGEIKYANNSATILFNKNADALVGQPFGFVIIPQQVQEIQVIQEQRILFVQMLASPIDWEDDEVFLISLRDVSELKKRELDLQFERQKLELSNSELSQYVSMATHDLREPVRKILLYTQRLIDQYSGQIKEEPFKMIEKVKKSASRLNAIIDGVAKFTNVKKAELTITPVDLNFVIKQVMEDIEILVVEKKVNIEVENLPIVNGDAGLLHQLFLNFLINSIKYSRKDVSPLISIKGKVKNGVIHIILQDNGLGFDNAYASKIFEPFQRLHAEHDDGTGIGLAICKRIVDTHKGTIEVQSKVNEGTIFTIMMPQVAGA